MNLKSPTAHPLKAGETIHVLAGGLLIFGWAYKRGDEITVTQKQLDGTRDRNDNSWADDISETAQLDRWNEQRIGIGAWPEGLGKWTYGAPDWQEQREAARKRAWAILHPEERAAALHAVEQEFGKAPVTSVTLNAAPARALINPTGNASR